MNYKEYKQKQKEEFEAYKQKLKADLDEFKEKLKIKLEKFKLKTKAKAKNTKKKPNKRKRKGGALREDEKQLIEKFVNEVILKDTIVSNYNNVDLVKLFIENIDLIKLEIANLKKAEYSILHDLLYSRLNSNYNIAFIEDFLKTIYDMRISKILIANFIILSTIVNYYHLFDRNIDNTYNVVYNLFFIIEEIVSVRLRKIGEIESSKISDELLSDVEALSRNVTTLRDASISGVMLKPEIVDSLCQLLIPYSDNYRNAIKRYIMNVAANLDRPSRPISKDQDEGRGREGIVGRFFVPMKVAEGRGEGRGARGVVGRLRGTIQAAEDLGEGSAMDLDRKISSDVDTRIKDRGMICRIDDSQHKK